VLAYGLLNWNERRIRGDRFKRSRVFEIRHVGAAIEQLDAELASEAESGSGWLRYATTRSTATNAGRGSRRTC